MLTEYGDPLAQEHTTSGGVSAPINPHGEVWRPSGENRASPAVTGALSYKQAHHDGVFLFSLILGENKMTNHTSLTPNQSAAMTALLKSCLSNMGGKNLADLQDDPFVWVDASDLVEAGWGQKEAEGTFGSLVSAGIVYHYEDDLFALTEDWDALRNFHA